MTLPASDEERRELARKATPGPWTDEFYLEKSKDLGEFEHLIKAANGTFIIGTTWYDGVHLACHKHDVAYIAAHDPPTVLKLYERHDAVIDLAVEIDALARRALEQPAYKLDPMEIRNMIRTALLADDRAADEMEGPK